MSQYVLPQPDSFAANTLWMGTLNLTVTPCNTQRELAIALLDCGECELCFPLLNPRIVATGKKITARLRHVR